MLVLLILKFANTFNFLVNISPSCQSNFIVIRTAVNPTDISVVVAEVADVVAVVVGGVTDVAIIVDVSGATVVVVIGGVADVVVVVDVSGAAVVIVVADVANVVVVIDVGGAAVVVVVVVVGGGVNIQTFLSACYHLFNFFVEIIFSLPLIHFLFL